MTSDFDYKILRKIKRAFFFLCALVFLFEAWLWDSLYPVVARLVDWLPWNSLKNWVAGKVQHFSATACVFLFIIPAIAIFPLKILGVWLVSQHYFLLGIVVFCSAKLVGLGLAAFLFETCKEKLLSLGWFLWLYKTVLKIRKWAGEQVAPAMHEIRIIKIKIFGEKSKILARLKKIRRNVFARAHKL